MLVAENIKHRYFGTEQCLCVEKFCLDDGEFVVIYGESGSAKTELLKCLAGLEKISEGALTVNGVFLSDIKPKNRKMVTTFEDSLYFEWKSVEKNLIYSDKIRGHDKYDSMAKAEILAENFHFVGRLFHPMRMLNEYYRAKVSIARVLMREDAEYFFFDNPLSRLKIEEREEIFGLFLENLSMIKGSIIYATNSIEEVMTLNKKTYVLSQGRILDGGSVCELEQSKRFGIHKVFNKKSYNYFAGSEGERAISILGGNPKTQIAAARIEDTVISINGDGMNMAAVIVNEGYRNGQLVLEITSGEYKYFAKYTSDVRIGQKVNVLIRRENILLLDKD